MRWVGGGSQGEAWEELGLGTQAKLTSNSVYVFELYLGDKRTLVL